MRTLVTFSISSSTYYYYYYFCFLSSSKMQKNRSCAWLNCRKEMAKHMHAQFCNKTSSLPQYRDCVMDGWCDTVMGWTKVDKVIKKRERSSGYDI